MRNEIGVRVRNDGKSGKPGRRICVQRMLLMVRTLNNPSNHPIKGKKDVKL